MTLHTAPLEICLFCDKPKRVAATVGDHINALESDSRHQVRVVEMLGDAPVALDLDRFDVIIIHYTLIAANDTYVSPEMRARLKNSSALKALFIQDEYRHIDATVAAFREMGLDILFTCMPEHSIEAVYPESKLPGVRKVSVLTGCVPTSLLDRSVSDIAERPIDVGYRARKVPAWLGDLGQEKWVIGQRFLADATKFGLICDISYREEERLYGESWINFVAGCKAILGVESGSSVFDFTGEIQAAAERDALADPDLPYTELKGRHFAYVDGLIDQRQISPRCFEAAALRTLMVLYEGHYSGLLEPWCHYVPLAKNHSNMEEVASVLQNPDRAQTIVNAAYEEIACNLGNHFSSHVHAIDEVLAEECALRDIARRTAYNNSAFKQDIVPSVTTCRRRFIRWILTYVQFVLFRYIFGYLPEQCRDRISRWLHRYLGPFLQQAREILGAVGVHRTLK